MWYRTALVCNLITSMQLNEPSGRQHLGLWALVLPAARFVSGLNTKFLFWLSCPRAGEQGVLPALPKFYQPYRTSDLRISCALWNWTWLILKNWGSQMMHSWSVPTWRAGEFQEVPALTNVLPAWTGRAALNVQPCCFVAYWNCQITHTGSSV